MDYEGLSDPVLHIISLTTERSPVWILIIRSKSHFDLTEILIGIRCTIVVQYFLEKCNLSCVYRVYIVEMLKATPCKDRLEALYVIRQCFTKSMIWIETQVPLGYVISPEGEVSALDDREVDRQTSMSASILYNLTKNLTSHLMHNLCAVLP